MQLQAVLPGWLACASEVCSDTNNRRAASPPPSLAPLSLPLPLLPIEHSTPPPPAPTAASVQGALHFAELHISAALRAQAAAEHSQQQQSGSGSAPPTPRQQAAAQPLSARAAAPASAGSTAQTGKGQQQQPPALSPRTLRARGPPASGTGAVSPRGGPGAAAGSFAGGGKCVSPSNREQGGSSEQGREGEAAAVQVSFDTGVQGVTAAGEKEAGGADVGAHMARCAVLCGEVEGALMEGGELACVQQHLARLQKQQLQLSVQQAHTALQCEQQQPGQNGDLPQQQEQQAVRSSHGQQGQSRNGDVSHDDQDEWDDPEPAGKLWMCALVCP